MNALRHVTYRAAQPWISEEDLVLTKTLGERIRYVRENLVNDEGIGMTQPQLASLVGLAPGHHGIGGWETRGREPKDPARHKLSQLTGGEYRPAVFSRSGAEVLVKEFAVPRLQSLEVEMETWKGLLIEALDLLGLQAHPEADQGSRVQQAAARSIAPKGRRR